MKTININKYNKDEWELISRMPTDGHSWKWEFVLPPKIKEKLKKKIMTKIDNLQFLYLSLDWILLFYTLFDTAIRMSQTLKAPIYGLVKAC